MLAGNLEIYSSLEGDLRFLENCPKDSLGNDITYMGVSFLHCRPRLHQLNAYVAATFLSGQYDETSYTLNLDLPDLITIKDEFKLYPLPYVDRAMLWLLTARKRRGVVAGVHFSVE